MHVLDPHIFTGELGGASNLPLNVHSNAYTNNIICKTGPGILFGFTVYNSSTSAQFIQVHDSRTLPSDGAVPVCVFTVAASSNLPVNWIPGRTFLQGLILCNSATGPTKSIGSTDCFFDVQFL